MDEEAALSDFEDDDLEAAPVVLPAVDSKNLGELDAERQARNLAEAAQADAEAKYSSVKKELDEALRQKEDALISKGELKRLLANSVEKLDQAAKQRDEAIKQLEMVSKQKEDASKAREQARSEIETAAKLLIAGAEKLTSLVGDNKSFAGGFPRSSKYTGLAAICHGFCKRTEELMEEAVKQRDAAMKSRSEIRDQMDQRNYQIAIEVSQLEASIVKSKEELDRKTVEYQKLAAEKTSMQRELEEKLARLGSETDNLKKKCDTMGEKERTMELELEKLKKSLVEQMKGCLATEESVVTFLHKIDGKAVKSVAELPFSDFSDAEKVHQEYLRRVRSISDMLVHMKNNWEEKEELRQTEKTQLEKELQRLSQKERDVVAFLKNSLSSNRTHVDVGSDDLETLASVLDGDLRQMRVKVLDLERQLTDASVEIEKLEKLTALQAKELATKAARIQELEERHGLASEHVEGLTAEIAAAEEELQRWKKAATEEAAAGVAILDEVEKCNQEIASMNQLIIHLKQSLEEANNKLQSKEEMAAAAIAARNAADRSLRIADERAAELRDRLEEMTRQMEEIEAQAERNRICGGKLLEVFPWLRQRVTSSFTSHVRQVIHQPSAEMEELTEPLV